MAIDEERRLRLYEAVRGALGDAEAVTLMEYLPPVGWADVATKNDLALLKQDLGMSTQTLRQEIAALELRMDAKFADLRTEMHDELREQTTRLVTWMIPTFLTSVGIAIAVSRLG